MLIEKGGVTSPKGFMAAAGYAGIGDDEEKGDMALIASKVVGNAAAVYTTNKVKGAHIRVMKNHLEGGMAQAIICNSGNANTCTANGAEIAQRACEIVGREMDIDPVFVLPASTGIIGVEMRQAPFESTVPSLVKELSKDNGTAAAKAIMTTDTKPKEAAVSFSCGGRECILGAVAKGSGMIHINMGTMLSFMTTDAAISTELLTKALKDEILDSYNQVSIDGDTSTNDTLAIIANGEAGNVRIDKEGADYDSFREALHEISVIMAKKIAGDGEGATKLIQAHVKGAPGKDEARVISRSIICSDLVKTAIFGEDANWGRVLCAIGYAPCDFSAINIDVDLSSRAGTIPVCRGSFSVKLDEEKAAEILKEEEVDIEVDLHDGDEDAYAWGCDLTYDYVKINGEYRT
jgi:glutamate N-acetyltransferase/amino-acid N-acetyltransferase